MMTRLERQRRRYWTRCKSGKEGIKGRAESGVESMTARGLQRCLSKHRKRALLCQRRELKKRSTTERDAPRDLQGLSNIPMRRSPSKRPLSTKSMPRYLKRIITEAICAKGMRECWTYSIGKGNAFYQKTQRIRSRTICRRTEEQKLRPRRSQER